MKREEIIDNLQSYFDAVELVCPHTYERWAERSWQFLDTEFMHNLLVIRRDIIKRPMYCNNWDKGGQFSQRGLRCNICEIVKTRTAHDVNYLSAHVMGKGGDFDIRGMTAEEGRSLIMSSYHLVPYPFRLEGKVNWLHIDAFDVGQGMGGAVF